MQAHNCLIIEQGKPYKAGTRIYIETSDFYLGRSSSSFINDISFSNSLISRRHCSITCTGNGNVLLSDLGSKHGTMVNGKPIIPSQPQILTSGDKIELAMGLVRLRLINILDYEETMDLSSTAKLPLREFLPLALDYEKRECRVNGKLILLADKEWKILKLLYENCNRLVTYDQIKGVVWSERKIGAIAPDVGNEELNMLVYRVRKKLGPGGNSLKTVRASGCMLEL